MRKKTARKSSSRFTKRAAKGMRYEYDRESDVLLITLSKEKPDFAEQSQNVITHYNKDGRPLEIEKSSTPARWYSVSLNPSDPGNALRA